jgi:nucleoside-triphosphatase THEP1
MNPDAAASRSAPAQGRILALVGASGAGKTTVCMKAASLARARGWRVAGFVSPARFERGEKVGIDVCDLRTGISSPLASIGDGVGAPPGRWAMHAAGVAVGVRALAEAAGSDLMVVDEVGPLELLHGEGWACALDSLCSGRFRLAVVSVRPALCDALAERIGKQADLRVIEAGTAAARAPEWLLDSVGGLP